MGELALAGAATWIVWCVVCGYVANRLPTVRLQRDGRLLRLRTWEDEGRVYDHDPVRIKAWKDRLPEAGALFPGGFSKRHARYDLELLERLHLETRRAELAHWSMLALAPTFLLWIPVLGMSWWLATAMIAYGIVANVPCILVQRYNRGRLARILTPRAPHAAESSAAPVGPERGERA